MGTLWPMNGLKIESGVVIPSETRGRPSKSGMQEAMEKMQVGQSIVVPRTHTGCRTRISRILKMKFTSRALPDGKIRIWRTA